MSQTSESAIDRALQAIIDLEQQALGDHCLPSQLKPILAALFTRRDQPEHLELQGPARGAGTSQETPDVQSTGTLSQIDCPLCGDTVKQVSSSTLSLALWQHVNWACKAATRRDQPEQDEPYFVEVDSNGCERCNAGKTWTVVGPDGCAASQSWEQEEDAEAFADAMNAAYWMGKGTRRDAPQEQHEDAGRTEKK